MLTAKQHELLSFVDNRLRETGVSPSFEEMKDALGLKSKSGIHRLISALEEREFIRRLPNRARALEILKWPEGGLEKGRETTSKVVELKGHRKAQGASVGALSKAAPVPANDVVDIPLHGKIAAGMPIEAIEGQSALSVPAALLGTGDHYALEVAGDSMVEAGILDGDYALIQQSETARDGEIVVALIHDDEATLKFWHMEKGQVRLDPANRDYDPQYYRADEVQIQGRMAGLLRRYH